MFLLRINLVTDENYDGAETVQGSIMDIIRTLS